MHTNGWSSNAFRRIFRVHCICTLPRGGRYFNLNFPEDRTLQPKIFYIWLLSLRKDVHWARWYSINLNQIINFNKYFRTFRMNKILNCKIYEPDSIFAWIIQIYHKSQVSQKCLQNIWTAPAGPKFTSPPGYISVWQRIEVSDKWLCLRLSFRA